MKLIIFMISPKILKCIKYAEHFEFTSKYHSNWNTTGSLYSSPCPLHPVTSRSLFIGRHVADSRKSPIANPMGRETILLFLFLRFAHKPGTGCVRSECAETLRPRERPGLNLDALPLSTREFLRAGIREPRWKSYQFIARGGVDTR